MKPSLWPPEISRNCLGAVRRFKQRLTVAVGNHLVGWAVNNQERRINFLHPRPRIVIYAR